MIELFLSYLILLICGSAFIMGWYLVTRGDIGVQPDGSLKKYGKILREWSFFWEAVERYKKIFYVDEHLTNKVYEIKRLLPKMQNRLTIDKSQKSIVCTTTLSAEEISGIENVGLCRVFDKGDIICLYIEEPIYRFPEWIRYCISQCPPCMASVYGSLFWWGMWFVSENCFKFGNNITGWAILYPFYIISLSVINYFIDKKI